MLNAKRSRISPPRGPNVEREQVRLRIASDVMNEVRKLCRSRSVSIAHVIESVLHDRLVSINEPTSLDSLESAIGDLRQDLRLTQGDIERLGEALAFYVYQWFCHTVPIPDSQKKAAAAKGKRRYLTFVQALQNRVHSGRSFLSEIAKDSQDSDSRGIDGAEAMDSEE